MHINMQWEVICITSEIYHGKRWRKSTRLHSPMATVNDVQVFLKDRIKFLHPMFGETTGVIHEFYMKVCNFIKKVVLKSNLQFKEGSSDLHMSVDVLLEFDQFKNVVEDPEMYAIPDDMAILYETLSIPEASLVTPITHVNLWPKSIATWDKTISQLKAMSTMVISYVSPALSM